MRIQHYPSHEFGEFKFDGLDEESGVYTVVIKDGEKTISTTDIELVANTIVEISI